MRRIPAIIALLWALPIWAADPECLNPDTVQVGPADCRQGDCYVCTPPAAGIYRCRGSMPDGTWFSYGPASESVKLALPLFGGDPVTLTLICADSERAIEIVRPSPSGSIRVPTIELSDFMIDGRNGFQLCVDGQCEQVVDGKDGEPGKDGDPGVCTEDVCKLKDHQHAPGGVLP